MLVTRKKEKIENKYSAVFSSSLNNYSYILTKDQTNFDLKKKFSFEFWVKIGNINNKKLTFFQKQSGTKKHLSVFQDFGKNRLNVFGKEKWQTIRKEEWYHFCFIYKPNENVIELLVMGHLSFEFPLDQPILDLTSDFFVGCDNGGDITCDMKINNLRIWNGGRTQKQVNESMNKVILDAPHLLGSYYNISENHKNNAYDNNHLTVAGENFFSEDKPF